MSNHILETQQVFEKLPYAVIAISYSPNKLSHRCGYVGVPKGHRFFGLNYGSPIPELQQFANEATIGKKSIILALTSGVRALNENDVRSSLDIVIDCHGGLTYSGEAYFLPPDNSFKDFWFFGFDCNHCDDMYKEPKSLEYCISECENIITQINRISSTSTV